VEKLNAGFIWKIKEYSPDGNVVGVEEVHNIIPVEGLDYILSAALKKGTQHDAFYVGLYEGNYTPVPGDTMASFPTSATELTAYTSATRPVLTLGDVGGGNVDNFDEVTVFTGTTNGKQAQGGFITTASAKGGTTGPLLSAVKFPTPRNLNNGGRIEVAVAFQFVSI
jgi:hypothetical protein